MTYRRTIPAPATVKRSYPGAQEIQIKGAARSGFYSVFVLPEHVAPTVMLANGQTCARAIASGIPAHRIHESYGVWPDNPDSTD